ncbi:MAG: hypothetical protein WEK74_14735, partial [Hydrogenophaga sp.]
LKMQSVLKRWCAAPMALLLAGSLSGCAVVAVVDTAASVVIGVGGLAVDAAVGTVRIGGKIVGAGADAVLGSDKPK